MPLSKKRNRERMRIARATCVQPNPVQPEAQVIDNLRQTIKNIEDRTKAPQRPSGEASLPLYDPAIHKPGDRVMVKPPYGKKLVEIIVPELDAGGQPVPNYD